MTLNEAKNGKEYITEKTELKQPVKRRLEAMGLIEGTMIRKVNEALDGSVIFVLRGTRFAIGQELAKVITVREVTETDIRLRRKGRGMGLRDGRGKGKGRGMGRGMGRGAGQRRTDE